MQVITLGTGSPLPDPNRAGPASLVRAGGLDLLFDCGRGVLMRMAAVPVGAGGMAGVFLTHLHSDHVADLSDLITTQWISSFSPTPMRVFGPEGTQSYVDRTLALMSDDVGYRVGHHADLTWEPLVEVTEIPMRDPLDAASTADVVFEEGGVRVLAAPTDHRPVHPTVGYRVEHDGRSVGHRRRHQAVRRARRALRRRRPLRPDGHPALRHRGHPAAAPARRARLPLRSGRGRRHGHPRRGRHPRAHPSGARAGTRQRRSPTSGSRRPSQGFSGTVAHRRGPAGLRRLSHPLRSPSRPLAAPHNHSEHRTHQGDDHHGHPAHTRRPVRRPRRLPVRAALRRRARPRRRHAPHALPRRGTGRRRGRAAPARRAVVELPLPQDDPGADRGRPALDRARPGGLRPLRQAGGPHRLHLRAPRRVAALAGVRRSSTCRASPSSARTGVACSACASSASTPTGSPASSPPTRSCPPATTTPARRSWPGRSSPRRSRPSRPGSSSTAAAPAT